ncbi:hypothetical protein I7I48_08412 [Histoplasma ohiense]|nr:hypothetical protein I7I48_08412 [Histoplasma ohiense (nom. inval.)]
MNYGAPLDPPSGAAASYQASTEDLELDPARQIGPTDISQRLDGNRLLRERESEEIRQSWPGFRAPVARVRWQNRNDADLM